MSDSPAQTQVGSVDGRCWHDTLTIRQVVEEYSIPEQTPCGGGERERGRP